MKASLIISFLILITLGLVDLTIYVKSYYQPKERLQSKYLYFGGCPSCHLVKQAPSECGHETQAWAWNECVLLEYLHPAVQ